MADKINALNVETGLFLHNLRRFVADGQQVSIGNKTIQLLNDTVTFIQGQIIDKAEVIEVPREQDASFLNYFFDPSHFELQQSIMCRLCNMSVPVTREDVDEHVYTDLHYGRLTPQFLKFLDQTGARTTTVLDFTIDGLFSTALQLFSDTMELDRSKIQFFDENGVEVTDFDGKVSQYLQLHSAEIEYKVNGPLVFAVEEVNSKGIACGVLAISVFKSTTVADICDTYGKVVRIKSGLIYEIVARDAKVIDLIDDDHKYIIDSYSTDDNEFYIWVKFIGDSPPERRHRSLVIKVKNGQTLNDVGMKIVSTIKLENRLVADDFQYSIDGKSVNKDHVIAKPVGPKSMLMFLLNMNQNNN